MGLLLVKQRPDVASELSLYLPKAAPFANDHNQIKTFWPLFCQTQNIDPDHFVGRLYKSSLVDTRRLFISVLLHLYYPNVFLQPEGIPLLSYGFYKKMAAVLDVHRVTLYGMVREVVDWEKRYDDYKQRVAELTEKVKELSNGCT